MNPILAQEWRTRWRGRRAFGLLLSYAALLCAAMLLLFINSVDGRAIGIVGTARAGHNLFTALTWMQLVGWLLLSPGLTAGGIAGERERGLLEGLQLSPLLPRQIISGKLASSLLFVLLVILVSQPVVGICFLLGGVSEGEYVGSIGLQLLTALFGASIGIYFSAWNRRAGAALRKAFAVVIIWSIASLISFVTMIIPVASPFWRTVGFVTALSHPASGAFVLLESNPPTLTTLPGLLSVFDGQPLLFMLCFQLAFLSLALYSAARAVRRPLPEQYWIEAKKTKQSSTQNAAPSRTASSSLWWELPFARLKFKNPLLEREMRSKFRMRAVPPLILAVEAMLALMVAYFYIRAIFWALFEPDSREVIWWVISFIALIVILIAVPVMGAGAFTRERESGTFQGLFLSLLSNREVVIAKVSAPLLSSALYGLPLLPLLLLCVRGFFYNHPYNGPSDFEGISVTQAIGTFLVWGASAYSGCALGMLISWRCQRTSAAIGWTLGSLFVIIAVAPILLLIANNDVSGTLWLFHPLFALSTVSSPNISQDVLAGNDPLVAGLLFSLLHYAVGCLLLVILQHGMVNRAREKESS